MSTSADQPLFREEQRWRSSPPILVIILLGTALSWFLFLWVVGLGRELTSAPLPAWLMWAILLIGGILFPALALTLKQTVEVHPDSVTVRTSPVSRYRFPYDQIVSVEPLLKSALREYTNRSIGSGLGTRTAYTVMGDKGVELQRADGSYVLIGSEQPEALGAALSAAWAAATGKTA
jgi:hypothetical protein